MPPKRAASRRVSEVTRAAGGKPSRQRASTAASTATPTQEGAQPAPDLAMLLAEMRRMGERQEAFQTRTEAAILSLQQGTLDSTQAPQPSRSVAPQETSGQSAAPQETTGQSAAPQETSGQAAARQETGGFARPLSRRLESPRQSTSSASLIYDLTGIQMSLERLTNNLQEHLHQSKSLTAKADGSDKCTVCVEGNIGSGKTTLLDYFRTKPGIEVIQEPVAMWRDVRDHNLLDLMYQNPIRWSTTMQSYVQFTMLDIHTRPQKKPVRMMERSIHSARYCFVENLHNSGDMSDFEFDILDKWYQWILRSHAQDVHVDRIVYLDTSPETCHERIRKRSRSEETRISLELLKNLHDLHESWLKRKRFPLQAPVLVIDANCDVSSMFEKYREHEDWIMGRTAAS